jgi:DNA-binding NtrC family response regulator
MIPSNITIAVLDRDAADLASITSILEDEGYRVLGTSTEAHLERYAASEPLNLVIRGFDQSHSEALPLMKRVHEISPDTEFIFCSRGSTIEDAMTVMHQGARDYLTKPVDAAALNAAVKRALERQALVAADPKLRSSLKRHAEPDVFVGTSPRMKQIAELLAEIAPTQVPVMITGESGTGKELGARAIHERSTRRKGPFIAINCAGMTDNLIESELFGHVRGAFTGAINDRPGAFQLAKGGTLFLDEIGDLSLKGQGDLLRVLEDGVFRPVGSPRPVRADTRILAATNRDLVQRANEGLFREDLLYRLNIVEIHLLPLRERTEDIPALVDSFNAHFSARHGREKKVFSEAFLLAIKQHPWPGNIRQLRNLIERLIVTVRDREIGPQHAPPLPAAASSADPKFLFQVRAGSSVDEVEAQLIRETLAQVTSNRREAARILGISPRALAYKIKVLRAPSQSSS